MGSSFTRLLARALTVLLAITGLAFGAAASAGASYTASPTTTWAPTSGRVYDLLRVGDAVVMGGTFTSLRSPDGSVTTKRPGLAAIDAKSGELLPWNPGATGGDVRVLESSEDGRTLYVGGTFTSLAGQPATGLGAVSMVDGSRVNGFDVDLEYGGVYALVRAGSTLYLGGGFTKINGDWQSRLAAVDATTGTRVRTFRASAKPRVDTMRLSDDRSTLLVGGKFHTLSGVPRDYLGSVDLTSGAATAWQPPAACHDDNECYVFDLEADASRVYAAIGGPGGQIRAYDPASGSSLWKAGTDGDVQAVELADGVLYGGGHFDESFEGQPRAGIVALAPATGAVLPGFAPEIRGGTAVWDILGDSSYLRVAGNFDTVDGVSQPRYTQFRSDEGPQPRTLVDAGSTWSYVDDGVAPGSAWKDLGYDASGWPSGAAQLGFGDGGEGTLLTKGHMTYWLRTSFDVPALDGYTNAALSLVRDDGAIVYVNGVEVTRSNMPTGEVTPTTKAVVAIDGRNESAWNRFAIPVDALRPGTNVIAVEMHQAYRSSSDISFDLRLDVE